MPTLEDLYQQKHDLVTRLEELEAVERNQETLESIKKSVEQIKQVMDKSSEDLGEIEEAFGKLKETHEGLKEFFGDVVPDFESVMGTGGEIAEGVGQASEMTGEVGKAFADLQKQMDEIEELIETGEKKPAEILDKFGEYLGGVVDKLGNFIGRIPGLGAFVYIYLKAIEAISVSVSNIQQIVDRNNAIYREVYGKDLYFEPKTEAQKRKEEIARLEGGIEQLDEQIEAHPDYVAAPTIFHDSEPVRYMWEDGFESAVRGAETVTGLDYTDTLEEFNLWSGLLEKRKSAWEDWSRRHGGVDNPEDWRALFEKQGQDLKQAETDALAKVSANPQDPQAAVAAGDATRVVQRHQQDAANLENEIERGFKLKKEFESAQRIFDSVSLKWSRIGSAVQRALVGDLSAGTLDWSSGTLKRFNKAHPEIYIAPNLFGGGRFDALRKVRLPVAIGGCLLFSCIACFALVFFGVIPLGDTLSGISLFGGDETDSGLVSAPEDSVEPATPLPTPEPTPHPLVSLSTDSRITHSYIALFDVITDIGTLAPNGAFLTEELPPGSTLANVKLFLVADPQGNVYLAYFGPTSGISVNFSLYTQPGFSPDYNITFDFGLPTLRSSPEWYSTPVTQLDGGTCLGNYYAFYYLGFDVSLLYDFAFASIWAYERMDLGFAFMHHEILGDYGPHLSSGLVHGYGVPVEPMSSEPYTHYPLADVFMLDQTPVNIVPEDERIGFGQCVSQLFPPPVDYGQIPEQAMDLAYLYWLIYGDEGVEHFQDDLVDTGVGNTIAHSDGLQQKSASGQWDIVYRYAHQADFNVEASERVLFNTLFPCGQGVFGFTVCAPGGFTPGPVVQVSVAYDGEIVLDDPTNTYQIGFVFDSDNDPSNNYRASAQFPNDFFDNTDRWYQLLYDPQNAWSLVVVNGTTGAQDFSSGARAIIVGNSITLLVPAGEFAVENPPYRVTTFRHTGDFGLAPPNDWDGDVEPAVGGALAETSKKRLKALGQKVFASKQSPEPTPTATTSGAGVEATSVPVLEGDESVDGFIQQYSQALVNGDEDFLFDRLHSIVLKRRDEATCRAYIVNQILLIQNYRRAGEVSDPTTRIFDTPEGEVTVDQVYEAQVAFLFQGQNFTITALYAPEDGFMRWFSECQ